MRLKSLVQLGVPILLGSIFFLLAYWMPVFEKCRFAQNEPYFACPVLAAQQAVVIRNDSYGKGHFGASRNGGRTHKGVDFLTSVGSPIFASMSGRILVAGEDEKGYGNYFEILHPNGLSTRYAHLSVLRAQEGDWVEQGTVIGASGKTGNAGNPHLLPHLHFEIRQGKEACDPLGGYLDPSLKFRR